MNTPPSLEDVARRAKVSISTVSRTITQTGKISAKTQERIRQVMRELGYRPNRVARRLRSPHGKTHLLGLIIPNIRNPFFADLARGVEDVAYRNNFAVLLSNYDEDPKRESLCLDVMQAESVDGIILPPMREKDAAVERLVRGNIAVVCVDRRLSDCDVDQVEIDNERGAFEAVRHLLQRGHRRISVIAGPANSSTGRERLLGYRRAHEEAEIPVADELIRYGDFKEESGRKLAAELLALSTPPTALFVSNNQMTIGALETIHQRKLTMPKDIALVAFDDLPLAAVFNPPLSVVRQPAYEVGRNAAELLLKRIEEPSRRTTRIVLAPELVVRNSS